MIRLDCARRASAISLLAIFAALCGVSPADAHRAHHHRAAVHAAVPIPIARPELVTSVGTPAVNDPDMALPDPTVSVISQDKFVAETPTIVRPGRRIYCVEFARLASGIALFGDAKTWWDKARDTYAQLSDPKPGAVMVFAGRRTMRKGHVAVVKKVISSREVLVDHANWGRDGEIYLNAPVIDVSADNDWSRVKVWNTRANTMGTTAYALKGFIAQRFASN